jgi:hypothetical protein
MQGLTELRAVLHWESDPPGAVAPGVSSTAGRISLVRHGSAYAATYGARRPPFPQHAGEPPHTLRGRLLRGNGRAFARKRSRPPCTPL